MVDDALPNTQVRARNFSAFSSLGLPTAVSRKVNRRRIYLPKVLKTMLRRPRKPVVNLPSYVQREVRLMVAMLRSIRGCPSPRPGPRGKTGLSRSPCLH